MLSRQFVRENLDAVHTALETKGVDVDLERILDIDEEWRSLKNTGDKLRHNRNKIPNKIGRLKQEGDEKAVQEAIQQSSKLKNELQEIGNRADELESTLKTVLLTLPQIPDKPVPVGATENQNIERRREGFDTPRVLPDDVIPH